MKSGVASKVWRARDREIVLGRETALVGILNVTPDSFSDGGRFEERETAARRAVELVKAGAALVDVGGESTRPGFEPVGEVEEAERVAPTVKRILELDANCILSVDTSKASVARASVEAGASVVNDVSGFLGDERMASVVAESGAGCVLMFNQRLAAGGAGCILDRIRRGWERSVDLAARAGVAEDRIALDPGVGFGTGREEDLAILRGLRELRSFGFPMMLGTSRKRITAMPDGLPLELRLEATLATTIAGIAAGVELFRVHDVAEHRRATRLADLIFRKGDGDE